MNYDDFLLKKSETHHSHGHQYADPMPELFHYQKPCVEWATQKGRSALFQDTGLGKTIQQLAWADSVCKETGGKVLILAPLSVTNQTVEEGLKFGLSVNKCRWNDDVKKGINIANYDILGHFDCSVFDGVVLDECFPPETPIDVFNIDNSLTTKYIKDISTNDKIFNVSGEDDVCKIYKRKINRAVRISVDGRNITCSENHPFFTMHGWRCAQDIRPGDCIMATREAMRMVREDIQTEVYSEQVRKVLREILLSEMENEHSRALCESPHQGDSEEKGRIEVQVVPEWKPNGHQGEKETLGIEPNVRSSCESKNDCYIAEDKAQTFRAWGKWTPDDIASANNDGCNIRKLDCGICYITGKTETRFSDMLQSRLGESRLENRNRDRWDIAPEQESPGRKKGQGAPFFRVESSEILEQGHPELEKYRDGDGHIYFYDIKAKRHPSFSVNGLLVHNSGILKNFTGKIRNEVVLSFRDTPYKLACSATPAPNDMMEIGNHAEFLGVMSRTEMLATFFVHDGGETSKWRLKGHAPKAFWKWMSTWALMMKKPSDIGFSNVGFELPELKETNHFVEYGDAKDGDLFKSMAVGLNEQRAVRKGSINERMEKAHEIINGEQWLIWCDINPEQDALEKAFKGKCLSIRGSMPDDKKIEMERRWRKGEVQILITKPSIYAFGVNWQHCHNTMFFGLSNSYEKKYQAVRRFWRFGQKQAVNSHVIVTDIERPIIENIQRKHEQAETMSIEMIKQMADFTKDEISKTTRQVSEYNNSKKFKLPSFLNGEK